jgi:S-DNA-T family DNA segregation ATPase FtsK/SpoIIIE
VATKSRSQKSSASKKTSRSTSSRSSSSRRGRPPAKKSTGRSSTARKGTAKKASPSPVRHTLADALEGRGADLTGLFLILVGILAALGIYTGTSGPLGRAFDDGFGWAMGVFRYLAPPVIIVAGLAVIRRGDQPYDLSPRMIVGGFAALTATAGLVHLAGDSPPWGSTVEAFAQAGGVLGLSVGGPLVAIASFWGALLILVALGVSGLLIMTGLSLQTMLDRTAQRARPLAGAAASGTRSLFVVGRDRGDADVIDLTDDDILGDDAGPSIHIGGQADDDAFLDAEGTPLDATIEIPVPAEPPADDAEPDAAPERTFAEKKAIFDQDGTAAPAVEPTIVVPHAQNQPQQLEAELAVMTPGDHTWALPPMSLLARSSSQNVNEQAVLDRGRTLERALAEHGVETRLVNMVVGPTVTRFELELGLGVKVARVKNLNDDIAYAMASPDVRIIAPIPGKQAIGVEVPNEERQIVAVGDILSSPEARKADGALSVAIGRDINGASLLADLSKMPHTLVAGATGAGKSSGINSIITSLLMRNTPDDVRMILIDPKRVEMTQYERIPHLLTQPVTDPKKAANALAWAVREMERRYELLEECRFRDIGGYNEAFDKGKVKAKAGQLGPDGGPRQFHRLPYILIVVDELADLMMIAARDVEESIVRIGQKARAVGIHMVIATQRPSVDVITGLIKANVPARVAYAVSSMQDSRVILGAPGAERLVGKGDMLFQDPTSSTPMRLQGAWVEESEVKRIVDHWRRQIPEQSQEPAGDTLFSEPAAPDASGLTPPAASAAALTPPPSAPAGNDMITADRPTTVDDDADELLWQAMELVVSSGLGSTSMLQRKLRVGFARAGRIMDELEQKGVVGPSEGSKARDVLLTADELQQLRGGQ